MSDIPNDMARQDAPQRDEQRQPPSLDRSHFTMTVDDASARFADAGLPRSLRSIQRYCQRGHLTCTTVDTEIAEMYLIDPDSVERRIKELQQIEFVTRAPGVSRQDAPSRDVSRHDATVRDTSRQEVSSEKIETYERRIKELEEKSMHLEIDKRSREQIINMLKEDRETLFTQLSNHIRTITDQARIIGQLETRLELGPGRVVHEEPQPRDVPRPAWPSSSISAHPPTPKIEERDRPPEPPQREQPVVEFPPNYGYPPRQGDNQSAGGMP